MLIPTINNADELDIVLERLGKQTYPHFELIIADSKSKDHTKAVCEKHGATWIDDPREPSRCLQLCPPSDGPRSRAFHRRRHRATLDWVAKLVRWFDNPEVGAVGAELCPDDDPLAPSAPDVASVPSS